MRSVYPLKGKFLHNGKYTKLYSFNNRRKSGRPIIKIPNISQSSLSLQFVLLYKLIQLNKGFNTLVCVKN